MNDTNDNGFQSYRMLMKDYEDVIQHFIPTTRPQMDTTFEQRPDLQPVAPAPAIIEISIHNLNSGNKQTIILNANHLNSAKENQVLEDLIKDLRIQIIKSIMEVR